MTTAISHPSCTSKADQVGDICSPAWGMASRESTFGREPSYTTEFQEIALLAGDDFPTAEDNLEDMLLGDSTTQSITSTLPLELTTTLIPTTSTIPALVSPTLCSKQEFSSRESSSDKIMEDSIHFFDAKSRQASFRPAAGPLPNIPPLDLQQPYEESDSEAIVAQLRYAMRSSSSTSITLDEDVTARGDDLLFYSARAAARRALEHDPQPVMEHRQVPHQVAFRSSPIFNSGTDLNLNANADSGVNKGNKRLISNDGKPMKKKLRGPYKCAKCHQYTKGHECPFKGTNESKKNVVYVMVQNREEAV